MSAARSFGGWTGGQYSLVRALTALLLAPHFLSRSWSADPSMAWAATGFAAVLLYLLCVGVRARTASVLLALLEAAALSTEAAGPEASGVAALLLLHAWAGSAPYGSVSARKRIDPRGDWRMPAGVVVAAVGGCIVHFGWLVMDQLPHAYSGLTVTAWLLLALPPAAIRPHRNAPMTVYYDGDCGFCHGAIRLLLAEDRGPDFLHYAPLQSAAFRNLATGTPANELPESMVAVDGLGVAHLRGQGALVLGAALGGWWRLLAGPLSLLPGSWPDAGYDAIARIRHRLAAKPDGACPLLPADLQERFHLE